MPKQYKANLASFTKSGSPDDPATSSTAKALASDAPAVTVTDVVLSHHVAEYESATVQQLLYALQANLKLLERTSFAPAAASSPTKKAPLVRASKLECKPIRE